MTIRLQAAGAVRTLMSARLNVGGSARQIRSIKVMIAGSLRTVFSSAQPLTASAVPAYASGYVRTTKPTAATVRSDPVTATAAGGIGPYTYAWSVSSGLLISAATFATATFSKAMTGSQTILATATCVITDSTGAKATCSATIELTKEAGNVSSV